MNDTQKAYDRWVEAEHVVADISAIIVSARLDYDDAHTAALEAKEVWQKLRAKEPKKEEPRGSWGPSLTAECHPCTHGANCVGCKYAMWYLSKPEFTVEVTG